MKRPWLWMLLTSLATASVTIALVGLPAQGKEDRDRNRPEAGLRFAFPAGSPAERAKFDRKLRDAVECMREHGAGPPGFESDSHEAILRSHAPAEIRRIAKACGLPLPPPIAELPAPPPTSALLRLDQKGGDQIEECLRARRGR
jgi:hypothetical protein